MNGYEEQTEKRAGSTAGWNDPDFLGDSGTGWGTGSNSGRTAYITLDYYGSRSDMSIVKSVRLNGSTEFTDYGRYETVSNLSTSRSAAAEPMRA